MENTTFTGIVKHLTPTEGISQNTGKPWKTLTVHVVNEEERYPTDVEAVLVGEQNIARFPLNVGDKVRIYLDLQTREHNGKRYNQISIWKVDILQAVAPAYAPQGYMQPQQQIYQQPVQQAQPMNAGAPAPWGNGYQQQTPDQHVAAPVQGGPNPNNDLPF